MNIGQGKRPDDTITVAATSIQRIGQQIEPATPTLTAAELISNAQSLRGHIDDLEFAAVTLARQEGQSWAKIGDLLGLTRQAVHTRYAAKLPRSLA